MKKWGIWLRQTALAVLGIAVLGSPAGLAAKASSTSAEGAQQNSGTTVTVVGFVEWPKESTVRNVKPKCTEADLNLPTELEAYVIVRTPNTGTGNSSENSSDNATILSAGQTAMETGENCVLSRDRMKVPVVWSIDTSSDITTSGTFNSVDGAGYHYTPVVSGTEIDGKRLETDVTLYQKNVPYIDVFVRNGISTYSARNAGDSSTGSDSGTSGGGHEDHKITSTHGIWIATEVDTQEGMLPDSDTDNNFRLTKSGTYTVGGEWHRIWKTDSAGKIEYDKDGNPIGIASTRTPVITVQGPGKFDISLSAGVMLDTTSNGDVGKPIIKVTGNAEVVITSDGNAVMACSGANENLANALEVERGSTVTISGQSLTLDINGRVRNEGTLIFTKEGGLTINATLANTNEMLVGKFDPTADTSGRWYSSVVNIGTNGAVVNFNGATTTIGDGSRLNVGGSVTTGASFTNEGTLDVGKNGTLTVANSFSNTSKVTIGKKGVLETGILINGGTLTVDGWTVPDNGEGEDGGTLRVNTGATKAENSGTGILQFGEGGRFTTNSSSGITVSNSGVLRIAERECLADKVYLEKEGENPDDETAGGKFYLTGITEDLIQEMPKDISYNGNNQYSDIFAKCTFVRKLDWKGVTFEVTPDRDWSVDICTDKDGNVSAKKDVTIPGDYYVVYKNVNRRHSPVSLKFHMLPAAIKVTFTNPSNVSADHPDLAGMSEEEIANAIVYELGADVKIKVDMAVYSRRTGASSIGESLYLTVKHVKDQQGNAPTGDPYLNDIGKNKLDGATYQVNFDSKGCATVNLNDIPTVPDQVINPGEYEVTIEYKENPVLTDTEEVDILENNLLTFHVVRGHTKIDLSSYDFQYTYGDDIPNPVYNKNAFVENGFGKIELQYDWYKTDNIEAVKAGEAKNLYLGGTFPTKEMLASKITDWDGAVAGDYVLAVSVAGNAYTTGGTGYRKINVARKDVSITIPNEPHKTYGTADADTPIEYRADGLVKWPNENGEEVEDELAGVLSRERDKTNVQNGVQGDDRFDNVGSYIIEKGTLDEQRNPNYKINLNGNFSYTIDPKTLSWGLSNLIVAQQDNRYKVYGGLTLNGLEEPDRERVGVTYTGLNINADGTALEVVEPKLININDAVDINYALNYAPPSNNNISIRNSVYQLKVNEGSVEHLSKVMEERGKTKVGIEGEMTSAIKALRAEQLSYRADDKYRIYDVMVTKDGDVVEDIFQKGGLIVTIPYPEGTNKSEWNFVAAHMITSDVKGAALPGTIEKYAGQGNGTQNSDLYVLEKTDNGIVIKVTGLSPVAIAWAPATPGSSGDNNDPNGGNNNNNNGNNNNNNGTNGNNNGTNGNNSGTNGNNSGTNGTNNGTNGTNNGTNGTNNGTNNNNNSSTTKTGTTSTRTTGVNTGDPAQIAFYSIATLIACLLLILIVFLIRAQFRKKE